MSSRESSTSSSSSDDEVRKHVITDLEEKKTKAGPTTSQGKGYDDLVKYYKANKPLPHGNKILWSFGDGDVKVGTVDQHDDAVAKHNTGKAVAKWDWGVTHSTANQAPQSEVVPGGAGSSATQPAPHVVADADLAKVVPAVGEAGQMANFTSLPVAGNNYHYINAQFRINPLFLGGAAPVVIQANIMNDTGSTIQTLYQHDWNAMNLGHNLPTQVSHITTANGQVTQTQSVNAQIRIVAATGNAANPWKILMDWRGENFVIRPWTPTTDLLSGLTMRMHLYFATPPGNQNLYISQKRNGVASQLPVV